MKRIGNANKLFAFGAGAALLAIATSASADSTALCLSTNDKAQRLRADKHFREAIEQLKVCSQTNCPSAVQRDCTQWLREVETSLPTVTFAAKDAAGNDLTEVKVSVDGAVVRETLDGGAIAIDPGRHTVVFEHDGQPTISNTVLISEGEKARRVEVRFGDDANKSADLPSKSGYSPWPFVLGGVGAVALGTGLALWIEGNASIPEECNGGTNQCNVPTGDPRLEQAKNAKNRSTIGLGVAIGGGVVLASGIGFFIYETLHKGSSAQARRTPHVRPEIGLGYAGLAGSF